MRYFIAIAFLFVTAYAGEPVVTKKSKLTFTGRMQAQFHASNVEKVKDNCNTFIVRRTRLCANYEKGIMDAKIEYELVGDKAKLKDAFINLKIMPIISLRFGQFKKPFSLWELTSDAKTMVIERDNRIMGSKHIATNRILTKDGLYAGHDIGAMFFGKIEKFSYSIGVFNGSGETLRDDDNAKLIGTRLIFTPIKGFDIGAGFSQYPITGGKKEEIKRAFELCFDYGLKGKIDKNGPWIQTEFLYGDNPAINDTAKFAGFAFIGGYNVKVGKWFLSSIRPAIRLDYAQRDMDDKNSVSILITPGIDLFFEEDNRLQINLDMIPPRDNEKNEEIELGPRIQFQMVI